MKLYLQGLVLSHKYILLEVLQLSFLFYSATLLSTLKPIESVIFHVQALLPEKTD